MAACILCGVSPTTKAHLIGNPLRSAIPVGSRSAVAVSTPLGPDEFKLVTEHHGRRIFDLQPRVLCANCNNAWMNGMEQKALPLLTSVVTGNQVWLDDQNRMEIASWALAFAIVRGEVDDLAASYDIDIARTFRERGLEHVPVVVWLVHTVVNSTDEIPTPGHSVITSPGGPDDGSLTILWLGRFAVIVGEGRLSYQAADGLSLMKRAVVQLWPIDQTAGGTIEFPTIGQIENRQVIRAFDQADVIEVSKALNFGDRHPYRRATQYRRAGGKSQP